MATVSQNKVAQKGYPFSKRG